MLSSFFILVYIAYIGILKAKQLALVINAEPKPRFGYGSLSQDVKKRRTQFGSRLWFNPTISLSEIVVPEVKKDNVIINVKAVGVCGSDIHMYEKDKDGYMLYPGLTALPVVPGHELAGEVVDVGENVTGLRPGDMVVVEEMWWCGYCDACRTYYFNQCYNLEEVGFTVNGGFEEYMAVPAKYVWKINGFLNVYGSEEKAYEAGSLVEPLCVCYNAMFVRSGGFRPGSYVVVWGAGPIGLAAIALANAAGAGKVIAFEPFNRRAELAKLMGADYVFNPVELESKGVRPYEKVMEVTNGCGADLHVEAAGLPKKLLPEMEKCLAIGGKIVWVGRADEEAPIFLETFQTKAGQVIGSQGHAGSGIFPSVIRLVEAGRIDMTKIITKKFRLEDGIKAMELAKDRSEVKITVKPS